MALSIPQLLFDVSWTTAPWATPVWVAESDRVRSFSCERGRQHELSKFDAGKSTLRLHNRDRLFDPTYVAGAHAAQLTPGRRYRLRAVWNSITYPLLVHFAERFKPEWDDPASADLLLSGVDGFKAFNRKKITSSGYRDVVLGDTVFIYHRVGEQPGSTVAVDSSGNAIHGSYKGEPDLAAPSLLVSDLDTSMDGNDAKGFLQIAGTLSGTGAFTFEAWFQTTNDAAGTYDVVNQVSTDAVPVLEFGIWLDEGKLYAAVSVPGGGLMAFGGFATNYADGKPHHVMFTRGTTNNDCKLYVDGAQIDAGTNAGANYSFHGAFLAVGGGAPTPFLGAPAASWKGSIDEVAFYLSALSSTRAAAHYAEGAGAWAGQRSGERIAKVLDEVDWLAADRSIDTGSSFVQAVTETLSDTSVLDHLQKVEESEAGLLFIDGAGRVVFIGRQTQIMPPYTTPVAVFGDGAGEVPYEGSPELWVDDTDVISESLGQRVGGARLRVFDSASEAAYGPASRSHDGLLLTSDGEVLDRINWDLAHYKAPAPRVGTIRLHPVDDPTTMWPLVLGLEIGQRVTVKARPVPKTTAAFSQDAIVEGIKHELTEDGDWFVDLSLGAADFADYWILGTSELGVDTRLAF